jgi:hypothetical protein
LPLEQHYKIDKKKHIARVVPVGKRKKEKIRVGAC